MRTLHPVLSVVVFTFVVFGVCPDGAVAQQHGKVYKQKSQKKVVEELPRIMPSDGDEGPPREYGIPPIEIVAPGSGASGTGIIYPVILPPLPPIFFPIVPDPIQQPVPPGGGTGNPPVEPPRVQSVFCSCEQNVYSHTIDDPRNVGCPRSPTVHYSTRISYNASKNLQTGEPDKSHGEVCRTGDATNGSKHTRKRITDYPTCGDDNSEYYYYDFNADQDRCAN
jgi:hypothetical protein